MHVRGAFQVIEEPRPTGLLEERLRGTGCIADIQVIVSGVGRERGQPCGRQVWYGTIYRELTVQPVIVAGAPHGKANLFVFRKEIF